MLTRGDKIAIVCCSNGQLLECKSKVEELLCTLQNIGLTPLCSDYIYESFSVFSGTGEQRATALMNFYRDTEIKAIFDISGGDLANEILEFLDFEVIKDNPKPFFGYSDLTTIINSIYTKTLQPSYLYQIRNLIYKYKEEQINNFSKSILDSSNDLFNIKWTFLQGNKIEGVVVGGNIRCLLKLAGTPYMPSFKNKVLFLESMGGEVALMTTYLNQLKQMGVFKEVSGILLGTFSKMEKSNLSPKIEELVIKVVNNDEIPIAKTMDVGHEPDSKCIIIGDEIKVIKESD